MLIVLATSRPAALRVFSEALAKVAEAEVRPAARGTEVLELARDSENVPALVVADADLPDMDSLALVRALLTVNPLINVAVLTSMTPEVFHDASEGLGVLMQLPVDPAPTDAAALAAALRRIMG